MVKLDPKKFSYATSNYNVSIWPLLMLSEMLCFHFQKITGLNFGSAVGEWRQRVNRWAVDNKRFDLVAKKTIKRIMADKKWVQHCLKKLEASCCKLINFSHSVYRSDLSKKNNHQLLSLYLQYRKLYFAMYLYGWVPNAPEGQNNLFSEYLKKLLLVKLKKLKKENQVGEYFFVMTTLNRTTVREQEQIDFLEMLIKSKRKLNNSYSKKLIADHTKKYCWLPFDYEGQAWTEEYFTDQAKDLLSRKIDPFKELKKMKLARKDFAAKQRRYWRECELDKDEKLGYLFKNAQLLMWWKNKRKDILYQSYFYMDKLIHEIAKRLHLTPIQVRHILPQEMKAALVDNKHNVHELNARIQHSIIVLTDHKIKIYTGAEAKKMALQFFKPKQVDLSQNNLIGQTAYGGQVTGKVKIINDLEDMAKMEFGDILVSEKTVPVLVPAMKKAAAIVTDQGGITCHAAIMARELKIPCVIGTKIATQIFNDGDKIRVNADSGQVVRI